MSPAADRSSSGILGFPPPDNYTMGMKREGLAFDIEIAKVTEDGSDWTPQRPLGVSCPAGIAGWDERLARIAATGRRRASLARSSSGQGCGGLLGADRNGNQTGSACSGGWPWARLHWREG